MTNFRKKKKEKNIVHNREKKTNDHSCYDNVLPIGYKLMPHKMLKFHKNAISFIICIYKLLVDENKIKKSDHHISKIK